jgi:hypothetical protein
MKTKNKITTTLRKEGVKTEYLLTREQRESLLNLELKTILILQKEKYQLEILQSYLDILGKRLLKKADEEPYDKFRKIDLLFKAKNLNITNNYNAFQDLRENKILNNCIVTLVVDVKNAKNYVSIELIENLNLCLFSLHIHLSYNKKIILDTEEELNSFLRLQKAYSHIFYKFVDIFY